MLSQFWLWYTETCQHANWCCYQVRSNKWEPDYEMMSEEKNVSVQLLFASSDFTVGICTF
jgi:hypothetical protein